MNRARRVRAERLGRRAEALAALSLQVKGYRILARRVRTPQGEIDLIAKRGALYAFVEVKARRDVAAALEAVSEYSWQRISAASEVWAARAMPELADVGWRFDLVAVCPRRWPVHVPGAWRPDFAPSWI
ncbi:MAG: YraN family protein [Pseudomonadota bacterium]